MNSSINWAMWPVSFLLHTHEGLSVPFSGLHSLPPLSPQTLPLPLRRQTSPEVCLAYSSLKSNFMTSGGGCQKVTPGMLWDSWCLFWPSGHLGLPGPVDMDVLGAAFTCHSAKNVGVPEIHGHQEGMLYCFTSAKQKMGLAGTNVIPQVWQLSTVSKFYTHGEVHQSSVCQTVWRLQFLSKKKVKTFTILGK